MNIEIANRLYQYRKNMGLSQEELAEKIGVSRQAVSKWERAEASPDTDNLIELAKIYGLTLDELLKGKSDADVPDDPAKDAQASGSPEASGDTYDFDSPKSGINVNNDRDKVHIGFDGIHVLDHNGTKVDIDRKNGIFVTENGEQKVYTDEDGHIHKSDDIAEKEHKSRLVIWLNAVYPFLAVIAYLIFGYCDICGGWAFGWVVLLSIPVFCSLVEAIRTRKANRFAYPVFAVMAFLIMGFVWGLWHPGWVFFLTIPIYYITVDSLSPKDK